MNVGVLCFIRLPTIVLVVRYPHAAIVRSAGASSESDFRVPSESGLEPSGTNGTRPQRAASELIGAAARLTRRAGGT
jgi:hypothetical protein